MKKYSITMDLLLGLNFVSIIAVALAESITNGDAKLTIILGTLNTFTILICRMTDKERKNEDKRYRERR